MSCGPSEQILGILTRQREISRIATQCPQHLSVHNPCGWHTQPILLPIPSLYTAYVNPSTLCLALTKSIFLQLTFLRIQNPVCSQTSTSLFSFRSHCTYSKSLLFHWSPRLIRMISWITKLPSLPTYFAYKSYYIKNIALAERTCVFSQQY